MRLIIAAIILLVVVVMVWLLVFAIRQAIRRHQEAHHPWELEEATYGDMVSVLAIKPGEDHLLIGAVNISDPDFDQLLWNLRAAGREKVYVLNQSQELSQ